MKTLALFCLLGTITTASAADISLDPAGVPGLELRKIELRGKITTGDARQIERLAEGEDNTVVFLDSNGGNYREGLALAKLFQQRKIRTVVAAGDTCLSACAIAFLGGTSYGEEGSQPFARSIAADARLGFHAPFIEISDGALSVERVEAAYDNAVRTVTDFVREARGLGISAEIAADMMTPQRAALYRIDTALELVRTGIEVQGVTVPSAMTRSMVVNLCVNGWVGREPTHATIAQAHSDMDTLQRDLKWSRKSTIRVQSGYFSADATSVKRTVLPMAAAGEGSGFYSCMVDHATINGTLRIANRGYIFTEFAEEILDRAKAFGQPGFEYLTELDVGSNFAVPAIDPLSPNNWNDDGRIGIVPLSTPVNEIAAVVKSYLASEPAL